MSLNGKVIISYSFFAFEGNSKCKRKSYINLQGHSTKRQLDVLSIFFLRLPYLLEMLEYQTGTMITYCYFTFKLVDFMIEYDKTYRVAQISTLEVVSLLPRNILELQLIDDQD